MSSVEKKQNLQVVKSTLQKAGDFLKKFENSGQACYSRGCKMYGEMENWEIALRYLSNLPEGQNIFNELIIGDVPVKPYLDIEWYAEQFPEIDDEEEVKHDIKNKLVSIFQNQWKYRLQKKNIYVASCHRRHRNRMKFSFHVVISTNPPVYFANKNAASFLAKELRKVIDCPEDIVDIGVYKKTQNFRLIGHSKEDQIDAPFVSTTTDYNSLDYIVTYVDTESGILLPVEEQMDNLYTKVKNHINPFEKAAEGTDEEVERCNDILNEILQKVKDIHPTAYIEKIDGSGFIQFNYTDRSEPCFTNKSRLHDKIGFFGYLQDNHLIRIGCHSGQCVDLNNRKIITTVGSITPENQLDSSYEPVSLDNRFNPDHGFLKKCINNEARGLTHLFESFYSNPRRIKWSNKENDGTMFFWNGKFWEADDFIFLERLIPEIMVKTLNDFLSKYKDDDPDLTTQDEEASILIKKCNKLINRMDNGNSILRIRSWTTSNFRDSKFGEKKDLHPGWLSCKNGMVNLMTGEIRPAVPDDNITQTLTINYNPDADSSDFDKFVRDITSGTTSGDHASDIYDFVRWMIGYCVQGAPIRKLFFMLYGKYGYNGKSLLMSTINKVLGMYSTVMDESLLFEGFKKSAGGHDTQIIQLMKKRIGYIADIKEDSVIDDGKVKKYAGGSDMISCRQIYGKQMEMEPVFVPVINTNFKVKINLSDQAMYNRLVLIPFHYSFVEKPNPNKLWERRSDPKLGEKFERNPEGILKWIVDASIYYHENPDTNIPEALIKAKEEYRREMSPHMQYLESKYKFVTGNGLAQRVSRSDFLDDFKAYWLDNYTEKYSKKAAIERFNELIKTKRYKGKLYYIGIEEKPEEEEEEGEESDTDECDENIEEIDDEQIAEAIRQAEANKEEKTTLKKTEKEKVDVKGKGKVI